MKPGIFFKLTASHEGVSGLIDNIKSTGEYLSLEELDFDNTKTAQTMELHYSKTADESTVIWGTRSTIHKMLFSTVPNMLYSEDMRLWRECDE